MTHHSIEGGLNEVGERSLQEEGGRWVGGGGGGGGEGGEC